MELYWCSCFFWPMRNCVKINDMSVFFRAWTGRMCCRFPHVFTCFPKDSEGFVHVDWCLENSGWHVICHHLNPWVSWNLLFHVNFIISRMVDETTDRARRFQPVLVPLTVERWLPHVMVTSLELANRAGLVIPKDDFPFRWATLFFGAFPDPATYFNQLAKHLIVVSFSSYPTRSSTI